MMLAIGIIAVLLVVYVLLSPQEAAREYEVYCTMECEATRYHNVRNCYMQHK
jgi:hypothetical protein